jgi:hypothetical protein
VGWSGVEYLGDALAVRFGFKAVASDLAVGESVVQTMPLSLSVE